MSYYPSYRSSSNNIKVELDKDLSNYATKDDVKKAEDKEAFSFIFKKIIMYMNVNQVHLIFLLLLIVLILKLMHGNQQVFLVVVVMI